MSFSVSNLKLRKIESEDIEKTLSTLPKEVLPHCSNYLNVESLVQNENLYSGHIYTIYNADENVIGICGLHFNELTNAFEVIYEVQITDNNKELFFPIADKLIDDAFNKLNVEKIFMKAEADSLKDSLIASFGLKCEGEISIGDSYSIFNYYELQNDNMVDNGIEYLYPSILQEWDNIF